jgi:hypothetical protein
MDYAMQDVADLPKDMKKNSIINQFRQSFSDRETLRKNNCTAVDIILRYPGFLDFRGELVKVFF